MLLRAAYTYLAWHDKQLQHTQPMHLMACSLLEGLPQAPVPIRIAFFNVEVCNSGLAVTNKDDITKIIYTDPDSLKNFWRQSSNSRAFMAESTSTVVDLRLPCHKFPIDSCNLTSWIEYVRDNTAALGGRNYSQEFRYQVRHSLTRILALQRVVTDVQLALRPFPAVLDYSNLTLHH